MIKINLLMNNESNLVKDSYYGKDEEMIKSLLKHEHVFGSIHLNKKLKREGRINIYLNKKFKIKKFIEAIVHELTHYLIRELNDYSLIIPCFVEESWVNKFSRGGLFIGALLPKGKVKRIKYLSKEYLDLINEELNKLTELSQ